MFELFDHDRRLCGLLPVARLRPFAQPAVTAVRAENALTLLFPMQFLCSSRPIPLDFLSGFGPTLMAAESELP